MLTDLFYSIIGIFISLLHVLLPNWQIPQTIINGTIAMTTKLYFLNGYFPVFTLMYCLGIIITYFALLYLVKIAVGLINLLRGSGGIDV